MMEIPQFNNKKDTIDFVVANKDRIIAAKKAEIKRADGVSYIIPSVKIEADKANNPIDTTGLDEINVKVVINTTNLIDSHSDVHMPGLWKKSLQENQNIMHLQEHRMEFEKIIADGNDLKAYTQFFKWSELGFDYNGETQALVFESKIKKDRNPFMFDQYSKGFIKQHSVGMIYVKLLLAVDSDDYPEEKENWDKYYPEIANKEIADSKGYFYVVKEAKVIEGSAVPLGSNQATPTLENNKQIEQIIETVTEQEQEIKELKEILAKLIEPQNEPDLSTHENSTQEDELEFLQNLSDNFNK